MKFVVSEKITSKNAVFVLKNSELNLFVKKLDVQGKLARIVELEGFKAKFGQIIRASCLDVCDNIWLVGSSGEKNNVKIGASIIKLLKGKKIEDVSLWVEDANEKTIYDLFAGITLRDYDFTEYKTGKEKCENSLKEIRYVGDFDENKLKIMQTQAECVKKVRDLVNTPPCDLYPLQMARKLDEWLTPLGVKVSTLQGYDIKKMGLLRGVGQASVHEPCVVVMEYDANSEETVALVGKGITYDSGGLSLKPSSSMEGMKADMSGAAVVAGVMASIVQQGCQKNVVGIVALAENMIAGNAIRPDDILTSYSKKTVEIINTDAEGRLVLADILSYVQEKHAPSTIIDVATLTGAIVVALGKCCAGMFSNDDDLARKLYEAGEQSYENVWRLPLFAEYDESLKSKIADIKHLATPGTGAGSSTAAAFLQSFITDGVKWAHLDIAGVSYLKEESFASTYGATGFGVRLLTNWLLNN